MELVEELYAIQPQAVACVQEAATWPHIRELGTSSYSVFRNAGGSAAVILPRRLVDTVVS